MSHTQEYQLLNNPEDYEFDDTKIEVVDGAKCILVDNPDQEFDQDFSSDSGFTYDSNIVEFASIVENATLGANYNTDVNANFADGVLTGTAYGDAVVLNGILDLSFNTVAYVDYDGILNANTAIQKGTIKFKVAPKYSGLPGTAQVFPCITKISGDNTNLIQLQHNTSGQIYLLIKDKNNVNIIASNVAAWSPTIDTWYEFALCFDITKGETRVFIEGNQIGSTFFETGERDSNIGLIRIGSESSGSAVAKFKIDDVILFDKVLYEANYTPGYSIPDTNPLDKIIQKDSRPDDATFYASFDIQDNEASWGDGSLTLTLSGGASYNNKRIDLTGYSGKELSFPATNNWFCSQDGKKGCIRFDYYPNYSGVPTSIISIFEFAAAANKNALVFIHNTGAGDLRLAIYDSSAVPVYLYATNINWFVSGQKYQIEINLDCTDISRILIDGVPRGFLDTSTVNRTNSFINTNYFAKSGLGDFFLDNVILFDNVQHIADFSSELPYTYYENIYDDSVSILPTFQYSGIGIILELIEQRTEESGNVRFILNDKFWNGSIWATSSDTWITANDLATINANLSSFNPGGTTVTVKIVFLGSNSVRSFVDELTIEYIGQIYPLDNPTIKPLLGLSDKSFKCFCAIMQPFVGDDTITFTIELTNPLGPVTNWYYDGSSWKESSGYPETNDFQVIADNIRSLVIPITYNVRWKAYFHCDTGQSTPILNTVTIEYEIYYTTIADIDSFAIAIGEQYWLNKTLAEKNNALHRASMKIELMHNQGRTDEGELWLGDNEDIEHACQHLAIYYGTYNNEFHMKRAVQIKTGKSLSEGSITIDRNNTENFDKLAYALLRKAFSDNGVNLGLTGRG